MVRNDQQIDRSAPIIVFSGQQTWVHMAMWTNQWQACYPGVELTGNFALRGLPGKIAIFMRYRHRENTHFFQAFFGRTKSSSTGTSRLLFMAWFPAMPTRIEAAPSICEAARWK